MRCRFLIVMSFAVSAACVSNPGPHPRALENNELCARYFNAGNLQQAEIHCDLALQFSPQYADIHSNKGLIYMKRGQTDLAKKSFIKALRYNQEQGSAYNNLGKIYYDEQKYGEAHDNFQRALKVNPDSVEARYNLGLTYMALHKNEQARKEFLTLIAINPTIADPYHNLCILSREAGNIEQAMAECSHAVQLMPNYVDAMVSLGALQNEAGRFCEAVDTYVACLERDENKIECRQSLPVTRRKCELARPELAQLEERARLGDQTPATLLRLGRTYREKGLRADEERTYRRCTKLDGRYGPCHYGLFEIFRDEGRAKEATVACRNFVKFALAEEFPKETETCELYLRTQAR